MKKELKTKAIRDEFAGTIIDYIIERTSEGTGYNPSTGRPKNLKAVRYSKEYAEEKGVGRSDVDLILDGNMLNALQHLKSKSNSDELVIGYRAGSKENGKAEGNQTGSYGKPSPNPRKARPFLGLTKKDLDRLYREFKDIRDLEDG